MSDSLYAVITGDVVQSTQVPAEQRPRLREALNDAFAELRDVGSAGSFEIYRGDSFQGVIRDPAAALKAVLLVRSILRKRQPSPHEVAWDARMAIGVGTVDYLPENVTEGDGEAYRRSGPQLDRMKGDERLSIVTPWEEPNGELEVSSALLDAVIAKWSSVQAETVLELLREKSRKEIGQIFDISQPAVHYRVKGAGWFAVEKFLQRYHTVIQSHTTS